MSLEATLDASVDGAVEFEFRVRNTGDEPVELQFRSSKAADIAVLDDGEEVWRWSAGRMFTQALQSRTLAPGESASHQFTWDDPQSGTYTARGTLEADKDAQATTTVTV